MNLLRLGAAASMRFTGDPLRAFVTFHAHFDGDLTGTVSAGNAYVENPANLAYATAPTGFGQELLFNSSAKVRWASNNSASGGELSNFGFGTGDLCVELFFTPLTARYSTSTVFDFRYASSSQQRFWLRRQSGNVLQLGYGSSTVIAATSGLTLNTRYHVAVVRTGGFFNIYVNGVASGTGADTRDYGADGRLSVAMYGDNPGFASDFLDAKIDEMRITKGQARYTGPFTPPSAPFPDA